jgi:hypothetical protein
MRARLTKTNPAIPRLLEYFEWAGLLVISIATVVAVGQEVRQMAEAMKVEL